MTVEARRPRIDACRTEARQRAIRRSESSVIMSAAQRHDGEVAGAFVKANVGLTSYS